MQKNIKQLLWLFVVVMAIASCSKKSSTESKYIPKDASLVLVVDPEALETKMKKGNLSIDSILKKLSFDSASSKSKEQWADFKNAGVDWSKKVYAFVVQKGSLMKGNTTTGSILFSLKDSTKFSAFIRKKEAEKGLHANDVVAEKTFSYLILDNSVMLSWTQDIGMVSFYNRESKYETDSLGNFKPTDRSIFKEEMKKEVIRYYSLKTDETIASIDLYNKMFDEKADGYMFGTSAGTLAMLGGSMLNLPKANELLKDNYSVSTFNFEDGKIVAKGSSYFNGIMSSILKKYGGPTVNTSFIENFPSQNINGAMLTSFNPEMISAVLKELEVAAYLDTYLNKEGLTSADIFKSFKGEINLVVSDFAMENKPRKVDIGNGKTVDITGNTPTYKMLLSASIGDKVAFAKIMELAVKAGIAAKQNNIYVAGPMLKMANMFIKVDDKNFILASDEATYNSFVSGTSKSTINADVINKIKGKSLGVFVDINSLLNGASSTLNANDAGTKVSSMVNNTFKDIVVTADNFDGTSIKSNFEFRMKDDKQNSLVSVLNLILNITKTFNDEEKRYSENSNLDNTKLEHLKELGVIEK